MSSIESKRQIPAGEVKRIEMASAKASIGAGNLAMSRGALALHFYQLGAKAEWLRAHALQPIKEPVVEMDKVDYKKAYEDLNAALDRLWNIPGISRMSGDSLSKKICEAQQAAYKAISSPLSIQEKTIPDQPSNRVSVSEILAHNPDKKFPPSEYEQKYGKSSQPSNEGGEVKLSEDLKEWMDNHAECDSDENVTLWINGATAMYRKLANDNDFFDSQIADYSRTLSEELRALQSELSALREERDEYRKVLENIVKAEDGHDSQCAWVKANDLVDKHPSSSSVVDGAKGSSVDFLEWIIEKGAFWSRHYQNWALGDKSYSHSDLYDLYLSRHSKTL